MFAQVVSMSIVVIFYFVILQELVGLLQISVPAHKLELWPGYVTSIRQHETNILLCCGINHKIMRQETALELLSACAHGDAKTYRVSVSHFCLGWQCLFIYQMFHYLFVCNVQKHLTLASVILCLCTGLEHTQAN